MLLALAFVGGVGISSSGTTAAPITTQPSVLPPVSVSPSPDNPAAAQACTKVLTALPKQLAGLDQRDVVPRTSPYVVAWGEPAMVLRCGVGRPAGLTPASTVQVFDASSVGTPAVYWLPVNRPKQNLFTTVDRSVYIEVTVPTGYRQPPLAPLSDAIASVLPAVCRVPEPGRPAPPPASLCTHRP